MGFSVCVFVLLRKGLESPQYIIPTEIGRSIAVGGNSRSGTELFMSNFSEGCDNTMPFTLVYRTAYIYLCTI